MVVIFIIRLHREAEWSLFPLMSLWPQSFSEQTAISVGGRSREDLREEAGLEPGLKDGVGFGEVGRKGCPGRTHRTEVGRWD